MNEQDEHGDRERRTRKREEKIEDDIFRVDGATFPPFFPLSFFFFFSLLLPPSPPFRGDLKVFHQHDLKALMGIQFVLVKVFRSKSISNLY